MSDATEPDRRAVLAGIAEHLAAREALVASVAAGERDVAEMIGGDDPVAEATRVLVLLEAVPGASKIATRRRLAELGVDELAVIGSLDAEVRRAVVGEGPR